jgi:general secretion pathway protein C
MLPSPHATWTVRGATFALWALAAGSAVYWGLKVSGGTRVLDLPAPPARAVALADPIAIAQLLGSTPAAAATPVVATPVATLASRLQLVGVAAGAHSGGGAAVIAIDGKPARPYRVGASIDEGLVLQSVHGRRATLVQADGTTLTLELPLAAAAQARAQGQMQAPARAAR